MDAISVLTKDHREVDAFFREFEAGADGTGADLLRKIECELSKHAAVEEEILYPLARECLPHQGSFLDHELEEHQTVKELLVALNELEPVSAEFRAKMQQLARSVRSHVEEEEGRLFPQLRQQLSEARLDEVGRQLEKAKKTAPTHAHPHAPNKPPLNRIAGMAAAVIDRARDALSGATKH
jgi:hemerythrin superfamily protein